MSDQAPISSKNRVGRPRKQGSNVVRKSRYWRLVIPNLWQFKDSSSAQLMELKYQSLELLKKHQKKYSLRYYSIALEHHQSGVPHLDIFLSYDKSVQHKLTHFDYLLKHGHITTYRNLNAAILEYGRKQDEHFLSNFPDDISALLDLQQFKTDSYGYLYDQMCKDPLHFNVQQYVKTHQLSKHIKSWSSIKTKLKDMQIAAANLKLKQEPGFKYINRALIQSKLSSSQLKIFDSWGGYQTIVNYLNQIIIDGNKRAFKSKHLLVVGAPDIGKTSLISEPNNKAGRVPLEQLVPTYHMGMRHWFPKYQDGTYKLILWNQMKLTSYSYDFILKFLEGSAVDLPYHGGATKKTDNQLIYMTSNLSLQRHIQTKFWNEEDRSAARRNLSNRIEELIVPEGYNLFLLQKLLISL